MGFNEEDKEWLDRCRINPEKYHIIVDNDSICVEWDDPDDFYEFNTYGTYFIQQLLDYIGCISVLA